MNGNGAAVQLWTVRNELEHDLDGALGTIAGIGYTGVELWFPRWPTAAEVLRACRASGLEIVGAHVPFTELRDHLDRVTAYHGALGNRRLVIPFIAPKLRSSPAAWRKRILEIHEIAHRVADLGFELHYHNHGFELADILDGARAHELIFRGIDAGLLRAELDTYFFSEAGEDPASALRRFRDRCTLLHIKDLRRGPDGSTETAEIGAGIIDWKRVLAEVEQSAVRWLIVEQDCGTRPAGPSLRKSFDYLRSSGFVAGRS